MIYIPKQNKSEFNWMKEIGLEWSNVLSELLDSEYSKHLSTFIEQIYLSDKEVYPIKSRLFTSVKDSRSSGIGRGIVESSILIKDLPRELREFRDCIYETIYGNQYSITNFDNSLDDYCDQDMLFLNCSMCVEKDKDYTTVWKHFIRNVIQEINKRKENIVYLFLTGGNLDLRNYIDESKNKVIINPFLVLPRYSTIFTELDEYIENNYTSHVRISW